MIRAITLHSLIYITGLVLGKGLGLLIFILFARALGPASFGLYLLFITYTQLATFIGDFGLQQWYQKHTTDETDSALFSQVLVTRITTAAVSAGVMIVLMILYPVFDRLIVVMLISTLFVEAMISLSDGYYIEHKKTLLLGLKNIFRMCVMWIIFVLFSNSIDLTQSILLYTLSALITAIWYFPWPAISQLRFELWHTPIFAILKGASPYASLIITSIVYSKGDSIAIKSLLGNAQLGIYGTAYRYLEALSIVPQALSQMLFPISAKKSGISQRDLTLIWLIFTGIGILCGGLLFFLADILIVQLIGIEYAPAVPVVRVLSIVAVLFFINAPLSAVVQSSSYINHFLPFGIANTVINIGLNILLLPYFGVTAAAWIMCTTELTGCILNGYFIYRIYRRP